MLNGGYYGGNGYYNDEGYPCENRYTDDGGLCMNSTHDCCHYSCPYCSENYAIMNKMREPIEGGIIYGD